jgi:hypothetical protein
MPKPQWSKFEEKVAHDFKARTTPGSGNQWFAKGDVVGKDFTVSCKSTARDSFSLKNSDWKEVDKIAASNGTWPTMALEVNGKKYVVMDYDSFVSWFMVERA